MEIISISDSDNKCSESARFPRRCHVEGGEMGWLGAGGIKGKLIDLRPEYLNKEK